MSFTADLFDGMAAVIDSVSAATYRATGTYQFGEIPILHKTVPEKPDQCLALTFYSVADGEELDVDVVGMQLRTRSAVGSPDCDSLLDDIFAALHGATRLEVNGIHVNLIERNSSLLLGLDQNQRHERSDNYYLTLQRPTQHRS